MTEKQGVRKAHDNGRRCLVNGNGDGKNLNPEVETAPAKPQSGCPKCGFSTEAVTIDESGWSCDHCGYREEMTEKPQFSFTDWFNELSHTTELGKSEMLKGLFESWQFEKARAEKAEAENKIVNARLDRLWYFVKSYGFRQLLKKFGVINSKARRNLSDILAQELEKGD